jgi:hypothetical protein
MRVENRAENYSGSLAAAAGTVLNLVTLRVPPRMKYRLKDFGNYMSVVANWGKVRWDFLVNDIIMYPYFGVRDQQGFAAARQAIQNRMLYGGDLFEIRVTQESGILDPTVGVSLQWEELFGA